LFLGCERILIFSWRWVPDEIETNQKKLLSAVVGGNRRGPSTTLRFAQDDASVSTRSLAIRPLMTRFEQGGRTGSPKMTKLTILE
jgi:hypothetical protein